MTGKDSDEGPNRPRSIPDRRSVLAFAAAFAVPTSVIASKPEKGAERWPEIKADYVSAIDAYCRANCAYHQARAATESVGHHSRDDESDIRARLTRALIAENLAGARLDRCEAALQSYKRAKGRVA